MPDTVVPEIKIGAVRRVEPLHVGDPVGDPALDGL